MADVTAGAPAPSACTEVDRCAAALIREFGSSLDDPGLLILATAAALRDAWCDAMWQRALTTLEQHPFIAAEIDALPRHGPCVYRLFGHIDDEPELSLLYVGGTVAPRSRLRQHLGDRRFAGVATIVVLEPVVWSSAIAEVELRAIHWERPYWNEDGVGTTYKPDPNW